MPLTNNTPEPIEVSLSGYLRDQLQIPVFPLMVPQDAVEPSVVRVVYTPISTTHDTVLKGGSGLVRAVFQFDVYGPSFEDVLVIEEQLRFALEDYSGWMGGTYVENVIPAGRPSGFIPKAVDSDEGTWRRTVEYRISYNQDVPARDLMPAE